MPDLTLVPSNPRDPYDPVDLYSRIDLAERLARLPGITLRDIRGTLGLPPVPEDLDDTLDIMLNIPLNELADDGTMNLLSPPTGSVA